MNTPLTPEERAEKALPCLWEGQCGVLTYEDDSHGGNAPTKRTRYCRHCGPSTGQPLRAAVAQQIREAEEAVEERLRRVLLALALTDEKAIAQERARVLRLIVTHTPGRSGWLNRLRTAIESGWEELSDE